jgi:hypothetical protein
MEKIWSKRRMDKFGGNMGNKRNNWKEKEMIRD